jgi:hypothetical protein
MISVARTAAPPATLTKTGTSEIAGWRAASPAARKKLKFRAYKAKAVRDGLEEMFHRKCAYCESIIGHITSLDVEHWRPKGGIRTEDGAVVEGYWWLAAEWTNLFPAPHCNRPTIHAAAGGGTTAGKGMRFPLQPKRAAAPQEGDELTEQPLVLNPSDPDPQRAPELHLEFFTEQEMAADTDLEGLLRAASDGAGGDDPLGAESIGVYGLNRDELVRRRKELVLRIRTAIANIKDAMATIQELPSGGEAEARQVAIIRRHRDELERLLADDAEYLLLARQFAAPFVAEL